jgi:hypothetical protein
VCLSSGVLWALLRCVGLGHAVLWQSRIWVSTSPATCRHVGGVLTRGAFTAETMHALATCSCRVAYVTPFAAGLCPTAVISHVGLSQRYVFKYVGHSIQALYLGLGLCLHRLAACTLQQHLGGHRLQLPVMASHAGVTWYAVQPGDALQSVHCLFNMCTEFVVKAST